MNFFSQLKMATVSLRYNKSRSFLTTLGIIIGVMTVIAILSLLQALNNKITSEFSSLGTNTIYIQKMEWMMGGPGRRPDFDEIRKRPNFKIEDAESLSKLSTVQVAVPVISRDVGTLKRFGSEADNCEIEGTTEGADLTENLVLAEGRFINRDDAVHRRMVCVIGSYIVDNLFGTEDPIGKTLDVDNHRYLIVGTLEEKGAMFGSSMDNRVIVPITTYLKYSPQPRGFQAVFGGISIEVLPKKGIVMDKALEDVEERMRLIRGLRYDQDDNFGLNTQQMLLTSVKSITSVAWLVMVGVAAISLIVGGIGIMNTMLVSVAERTREIGIRKSVGARDVDILWQFLLESVVLSMLGGAIGIVLGLGIALLASGLFKLEATAPWWTIILGFGFSAAVGIFFGIYPAQKAAKLNPINAIRYE